VEGRAITIIGAGPFGLATAAEAKRRGIPYRMFGRPMELWRQHMPQGMLLRSASGWHLDARGVHTFDAFATTDRSPSAATNHRPIALNQFLDYSRWFIERTALDVDTRFVTRLSRNEQQFDLVLDDDTRVHARNVVCTPGVRYFLNVPDKYVRGLPRDVWCHSTDIHDLTPFRGRRCLIIGGRQSAYELGTLLERDAAADITIVHRHPAPAFVESDWSWVAGDLQNAERTPGWFSNLPAAARDAIQKRFWSEGRLKLEPWLGERLAHARLTVKANTAPDTFILRDGTVDVSLGNGESVRAVDRIILATGFAVDVARVPYMTPSLLASLGCADGYPVLGDDLQSVSVPNLYFAGLVAARAFGPYMGFLAACPFAAQTIVNAIESSQAIDPPRNATPASPLR